jgi:Fe2+ transport system protein FeoA
MIVCSLCGLAYAPGGVACRERACPLAFLGCTTDHCPRCGYATPDERGSLLARWTRRLLARPAAPRAAASDRLADLGPGKAARVAEIAGDVELRSRLTAQGLVPGAEIRLVQTWPAFIVEMGETTLAFERRVAEAIRVSPEGEAGLGA